MIEPAVVDRALKRYPMLNDLPAAERASVFRAASLLQVPVGATLFDEGEPCRGFALVLSGAVRV
jgi:CRP/FNR family transcriptional regulator, anaerobic regulatory protein